MPYKQRLFPSWKWVSCAQIGGMQRASNISIIHLLTHTHRVIDSISITMCQQQGKIGLRTNLSNLPCLWRHAGRAMAPAHTLTSCRKSGHQVSRELNWPSRAGWALSWEFTAAGLEEPLLRSLWFIKFRLHRRRQLKQQSHARHSRAVSLLPYAHLCSLPHAPRMGHSASLAVSQIAQHIFRELLAPSCCASNAASSLTSFQLCSQAHWVSQS